MIEKLYEIFLKSNGVSIDTRTIKKGQLFFALKGEKFDGHHFVKQAIEKGAIAAVIDNPNFKLNAKTIIVDNTLKTLQKLANYHRKKLNIKILAITGTNGKTTTKELTARVLMQKFRTYFTKENLNNHIGVPINLLSISKNTQFAVIEMGASYPDDIKLLCNIADPDFGIITNIYPAHIQGFGDFKTLIKTKAQLYDHLKNKNGLIFYNTDNKILVELINDYNNIFPYGLSNGTVKGKIIAQNPYLSVEIYLPKKSIQIHTHLIGNYNLENIIAAAAVGEYFKIDPTAIKNAIENYIPKNNRSQLENTGKNWIIRDFYNANPTSMLLALENFLTIKAPKKAVILGDMLELGNYEKEGHYQILKKLENTNVKVFLVGKIFSQLNKNPNFKTYTSTNELNQYLLEHPIENHLILLKASRGIHLENVLKHL